MSKLPLYLPFRGDTEPIDLPLFYPRTTIPFAATGHSLILTLKLKENDPDELAKVQKQSLDGSLTVIGLDHVRFRLFDGDWAKLTVGTTYTGDVQAQEIATGIVSTVYCFQVRPRQDITLGTAPTIPTITSNPTARLELADLNLGSFPAASDLASSSFVHLSPAGLVPADASAMRPAHGFIRAAAAAGEQATLYGAGALNGLSGLSPGATYYLSATTPGQLTAVPPAVGLVQPLGVAAALDILLVALDSPILAIA